MDAQFVWTKKFNRILNAFCDSVPLNAHRHYFRRSVPNSFSGKCAIDTMMTILVELFPDNNIQRLNAQKVLELLIKDDIIISVNQRLGDQLKDEKDVFYRFGKQFSMDKYVSRPRRSVSVDDNRKRFSQPRMSIIAPDHFNSEPEICGPSTSNADNSVMNSTENINEEKPNRVEVDEAALRFLKWIYQDESLSEQQRKKTLKAFKAHYPHVFRNFMSKPRKSPSIASAPNCISYRQQNSTDSDNKFTPLFPSTSQFSIQSDLARSIDELNQTSSPKRKISCRLSETDLNMQLLQKLDSVIENPIYSGTDRNRILKYFKHVYPSVYNQRFNGGERPLLKKIREFLPKISGEVR